MRILFIYRSSRKEIYRLVTTGQASDSPLYGLNHLEELGASTSFFDEDKELGGFVKWIDQFSRKVIIATELGWNIGQAIQSLKRLRNYDLIFATTDSTGLPLAFLKRLGMFPTPLVIASQGLCQFLSIKGWNWAFRLHRWSLKSVDHIMHYGYAEGEQLCRSFGLASDKVSWIPIGIDTRYFSPLPVIELDDVVLSVGRDRCRDYALLMEVARCLPLRFRVITTPGCLSGISVPPNVEVFFDLPIEEVRRHYAACRFVVLPIKPSSYSFGTTVVLECLNMGKAVIVSKTDAVGEREGGYQLVDGVHCRFIPPGDAGKLCNAIQELWARTDLCNEFGRHGRLLVEDLYNSRAFAKRLSNLFTQVISKCSVG